MRIKHLCVLIHIRNKGEVGTVKMFKPSSNFLTDHSKAVLRLWILFLLFVFRVCLCHSVLSVLAALWSPAQKGLTSWLPGLCFLCFVTFLYGVLGQVWYLIISDSIKLNLLFSNIVGSLYF